jgi:hypothetical protein
VFHQQAVDEDISATDAAQEDQVITVVEAPHYRKTTAHAMLFAQAVGCL